METLQSQIRIDIESNTDSNSSNEVYNINNNNNKNNIIYNSSISDS